MGRRKVRMTPKSEDLLKILIELFYNKQNIRDNECNEGRLKLLSFSSRPPPFYRFLIIISGVVMKTLLNIFFAVLITVSISLSYEDFSFVSKIITGSTPVQIFNTNIGPVIYCAGIDVNFNGEFDDGDEAPSLWLLTPEYLTYHSNLSYFVSQKLIDLDFGISVFPARNYWDEKNNSLYLINANSIDRIKFENNQGTVNFDRTEIIKGLSNVSAVSASDEFLFISIRKFDANGEVLVYNLQINNFIDTISAGINVQMTQYLPHAGQLFILNEGTFGADNGSLQIYMNILDDFVPVNTIPIAGSPNHFFISGRNQKIFVTCNHSNEVIGLGFNKDSSITKFHLPEYNGIRETVALNVTPNLETLFATTSYNDVVYLINSFGEIKDSIKAYGKAESVYSDFNSILIATPFIADTYTPDSSVTLYSRPMYVDNINNNLFSVSPNPVIDRFEIQSPGDIIINSIDLINLSGDKVYTYQAISDIYRIPDYILPPGKYFLKLKHSKGESIISLILL